MGKSLTKDEFISRAKLIHGDKYDYSESQYVNRRTKVCIKCSRHGAFLLTPDRHLKGFGCQKCSLESRVEKRTFTKEEFIAKAREVHGDKFDYSKVVYVNSMTKVCIICPIHGETYETPSNHLRSRGCLKCYHDSHKSLVCGVGVNDISYCDPDIYRKWSSMIKRCYSTKVLKKHPSYQDCSVSDEWLILSNFKSWYENNYIEGYDLDKDLLVKGNKIYAAHTCCFIPKAINIAIKDLQKGKYAKGVSIYRHNKYISSICINRKKIHLGCFDTQKEATKAYKIAKEQHFKELAEKYFQEGKITRQVYDALMKYEVDITD